MVVRETFYRASEIRREFRTLPAAVYNLTRVLLQRSDCATVFIPIRSMLYQGVIDREEIIFVDAAVSQRDIVLAWQHFGTRDRSGLDQPVAYQVAYYKQEALGIMPRLQGEFFKALTQTRLKQIPPGQMNARVIPMEGHQSDSLPNSPTTSLP